MMHVGDIMSTVGGFSVPWKYSETKDVSPHGTQDIPPRY